MIAQASPQAYGLNIVGLVWGSLKLLLVIAKDITSTYDTIVVTLESVRHMLPNLGALTDIYGDSEIQVLHKPLIDIYSAIISFSLETAKYFSRAAHGLKTITRSAWTSLQAEFESSLSKMKDAGRRVEQAASIEHMYATDIIRSAQESENLKQQTFRRGKHKYLCKLRGIVVACNIKILRAIFA